MASNKGRTCPKCGMNLGQKHLCPVCDKTEENTESAPNPAADAGGNTAPTASQGGDYVSSVIEFIGEHPDDWDEEFNAFFDGLPGNQDYVRCYDTCSRVSRIIPKDKPVAGKIPGSMTIKVMQELKNIFPDLSDGEARELAMRLLEKRAVSILAPPPPGSSAEVMDLYRKATNENDAVAQNNLGYAYAHGEGVKLDKAEAVKWYRKAAERGNASAQYNLGLAYDYGKGVSEDKAEAVKWYRKAAEQGHATAQYNLGYAYAHGEGVSEDKAEAVKWYRKAAEQGDASAQYNLGYAYAHGEGVSEDKAEAVKWYRKAAEQGNASAQFNLGYCYDFGEGVSEDKEEAEKWYRKAAEQGHEKARLWMKKLKL